MESRNLPGHRYSPRRAGADCTVEFAEHEIDRLIDEFKGGAFENLIGGDGFANLINDGGDGVQIALRSSLAIGPQSAMHAELVRQNQGDPKKFIDPEKLMDLITLVKRHNGASGKSKPAPRLPTPIPRTYQIVKTSHSIQRTLDRGFKLVDLDDTIVNGREIPTHEMEGEAGISANSLNGF